MQPALILLLKYKYLLLFPLAAFEGPIISVLVGFLVYSGVLNFWLAFIILIFGDIIPDTIYYYLGYFSDRSKFFQKHFFNSKFFINNSTLIKKIWTEHAFKTMFFSKLAYGLATPFLISAGIIKIPYKKYISYTIPITCFQYGAFMGIGYYLGKSYESAFKYINDFYIVMAFMVIIFLIIYVSIVKYARREIISLESVEEEKQ
jgi:membrane protein DedA with SNARE-associated domain